jgi:16S rRNA (uracil1498-N3)-methyltransferase
MQKTFPHCRSFMVAVFLHVGTDSPHDETVTISGPVYHHLVHVRRLTVGDPLRIAFPNGSVYDAVICSISDTAILARVTGQVDCNRVAPPCRITLFQAVLKGEKMDWVVQKATELGVTTLTPLLTRRSVPRLVGPHAAARTERWQRIADSASAQCERPIPLHVAPLCTVNEVADRLPVLSLLLHEREGRSLAELHRMSPTADTVGLLIGPEGGWDPDERATLLAAGTQAVLLGPRILRAETAATVAVTLTQYLWGDLGEASLESE